MAVLQTILTKQLAAAALVLVSLSAPLLLSTSSYSIGKATVVQQAKAPLSGAWRMTTSANSFKGVPAGATAVAIRSDNYFSVAIYDQSSKKFWGTYGGTYTLSNGQLTETLEFNTLDSATVGTSSTLKYTLPNGRLQVTGARQGANVRERWERINSQANSPLAGAWRITGRAGQDGSINTMQRGPRKTIKILSDNRFQWIAFNTETKQFSGTGGGTYTAENGDYIETIEFFSRDADRVGAVLPFNFEIKDGKWHHSGLSSTGNKVYEVWEKE